MRLWFQSQVEAQEGSRPKIIIRSKLSHPCPCAMCALIYNHRWLRFNYIYIFIQLIITNHNVEKPIVQIITVVNPNPCFDRIKLNLTERRPNISFKDLVICAYIIITYGYLKKKERKNKER